MAVRKSLRIYKPLLLTPLAVVVLLAGAADRCGLCATVRLDQPAVAAAPRAPRKPTLRFRKDGRLRIVQFTDIHSGKTLDTRVEGDMGRYLDTEKPDFVVLTGDLSTGNFRTPDEVRTSIAEIGRPMESRRIPWAAVLGNHDPECGIRAGVTKAQMLAMYRARPYNVNPPDPADVYGAGNGLLTIPDARGGKPVLGIWLIDSNSNAPAQIGGQKLGGYDWIHVSQIAWYYETSRRLEKRLGHKLESLMFLHICLPEFKEMAATRPLIGDRKDSESPSNINSGMFAALLDRGDVMGLYVGHDHYNSYEGSYYGIRLGYGGAIKFAAHRDDPTVEPELNKTRGARVFTLDERDLRHYETHFKHVSDFP